MIKLFMILFITLFVFGNDEKKVDNNETISGRLANEAGKYQEMIRDYKRAYNIQFCDKFSICRNWTKEESLLIKTQLNKQYDYLKALVDSIEKLK